jgi:hypothetical protein
MTQETEWLPYQPMFGVYTKDGQTVREPVMRRKTANGTWEYRLMSEAEYMNCRRSLRAGRSVFA